MTESITLHGFGDNDRSGKVRWTARELGLGVEEVRVKPGDHRRPPYTELNPFAHVPTVVFRGQTLFESTAICHTLAEAFDAPKLFVARGEPERQKYLFWLAAFGETLESRLVECAVSRAGILDPQYFSLHEHGLRFKLGVLADLLPKQGFLAGDRFTIADVVGGYGARLAIQCGLIERQRLEPWFSALVARPAAIESRIFASL
ncbi:MAG: glutathione S-transferase family protein [Myxococcales bacterium]|nr:glutathione S-transferase family protein [Myxococcales bacterium]